MAASDYTGKEKTSLANIKEMIANATSLEEIRGNMGLGYTLGVLQAANGGTGVSNLQDVADAIVDAILLVNGFSYNPGTQLASANYSGSATGVYDSYGHGTHKATLNVSPNISISPGIDGISYNSGVMTFTKPGVYRLDFTSSVKAVKSGIYGDFGSATASIKLEGTGFEGFTSGEYAKSQANGFNVTANASQGVEITKKGYGNSTLKITCYGYAQANDTSSSTGLTLTVNDTISVLYSMGA